MFKEIKGKKPQGLDHDLGFKNGNNNLLGNRMKKKTRNLEGDSSRVS